MSGVSDGDGKPEGAILDEAQIKKLKIAITVMSAVLVVGIITLIARVIHLANRADPVSAGGAAAVGNAAGTPAAISGDLRLSLPAGAALKGTSLQGNRLLAHYTSPRGDGLIILDLASGRPISHIKIDAAP